MASGAQEKTLRQTLGGVSIDTSSYDTFEEQIPAPLDNTVDLGIFFPHQLVHHVVCQSYSHAFKEIHLGHLWPSQHRNDDSPNYRKGDI